MKFNRAQWFVIWVGVAWLSFVCLFPPFTNPVCQENATSEAQSCELGCLSGISDLCEVSRFFLHHPPPGYIFDIGLFLEIVFFVSLTVAVWVNGLRNNVWWAERFAFASTMIFNLGFCMLEIFAPSACDRIFEPLFTFGLDTMFHYQIFILLLVLVILWWRNRKLALKTLFIFGMVMASIFVELPTSLWMPGVFPPKGYEGVDLYNFSVGLALQLGPIDVLVLVIMIVAGVIQWARTP
jgi:hypothetical protein